MFVSVTAAMAAWQWDNITAVIDGIRYDEEQLNEKKDNEIKKVDDYFEQNNLDKVTPLTQEQEQALQSGEITEKDAIDIMTGKISLEEAKEKNLSEEKPAQTDNATVSEKSEADADSATDKDSSKPVSQQKEKAKTDSVAKQDVSKQKTDSDTASDKSSDSASKPEISQSQKENNNTTEKPEQNVVQNDKVAEFENKDQTSQSSSNYDSLISSKVAELYVIKSNFYSSFNSQYSAARSAFLALPKSERTKANLAATVKSYMSVGLAMEKECDAQVEAILSELTSLLKQAGRDLSLVQSIRNAYNSEKSSFKSSLISKYF